MTDWKQRALLPFQRQILSSFVPGIDGENDETIDRNALLILARGLGLRTLIATLLRIYESPDQLVLVVNATPEEERGLAEEVGIRLKSVGYEMPAAQRQDLYKSGGLLSVTSRILSVDMLNEKIPVALVAGLIVLHAETVTPMSQEAFVVRIFRNQNKTGFIKAFSDQPEAFTFGLSPLQTVLQQLKIREVIIWPRFHENVKEDLQKRRADVIELYQPLTTRMRAIQSAIVEAMQATLNEIKRSNASLEIEDLTVENALFRSFDSLVRRQLDPVWHKVGPQTRQLVSDLTTLRKLQLYLLDFDCVSFNRFLETVLFAQETTNAGTQRVNKSPWLFTDAADTIFKESRARVYEQEEIKKPAEKSKNGKAQEMDEFDALLAAEAEEQAAAAGPTAEEEEALHEYEMSAANLLEMPDKPPEQNHWLPPGVTPVLEEQPKWHLLAEVLDEIEQDLHFAPMEPGPSNDTILIMCSSSDACSTLSEYLSKRSDEKGAERILMSKLESYFFWKGSLGKLTRNMSMGTSGASSGSGFQGQTGGSRGDRNSTNVDTGFESAALKRKKEFQRGVAPSNKRRRVRGGGAVGSPSTSSGPRTAFSAQSSANAENLTAEAGQMADLLASTSAAGGAPGYMLASDPDPDRFNDEEFDAYFGLLSTEDLVVIRPYTDDDDDRVLEELRPKYVVMYDPDPAFIRRVECYRAAQAGMSVRVYFLMYKDSVEEQRYLASIRKEKDAFEKLIREKAFMALPHEAEYRPDEEQETLRTFNTRAGGAGRQATTEPSRVVVDVREFWSSLPSLLHADGLLVVPKTLAVGDYILTPEMCVERKSLPDLIQSFNSGRLFSQCEQMTTHYMQPLLLIEFDEKKSFNLETYVQQRQKNDGPPNDMDLRAKIVLLTLSFPRLRIIWSSSPYQTVEIFRELKENREEPNADRAVQVGAEEAGLSANETGEAGFSAAPQEMLMNLPGITVKNCHYVMSKVDSIEHLCEMTLEQVQQLIGNEPGAKLHNFLHQDATARGASSS